MKKKASILPLSSFLLLLLLAIIFVVQPIQANNETTPAHDLHTSDVIEAPPLVVAFFNAGADAPLFWSTLSDVQQDEIIAHLVPQAEANGETYTIVDISVKPAEDTIAANSSLATQPFANAHVPANRSCYNASYGVDNGARLDGRTDGPGKRQTNNSPHTTTMQLQESATVSNSLSATAGISVQAVEAAVGITYNRTHQVTYSDSTQVSPGQTMHIQAYNWFHGKGLDIYRDCYGQAQYLGDGTAWSYAYQYTIIYEVN